MGLPEGRKDVASPRIQLDGATWIEDRDDEVWAHCDVWIEQLNQHINTTVLIPKEILKRLLGGKNENKL